MDIFLLFGPALFMCLILTGIHCYLGLHVLARKIIFVDLALAQSAAFGLAVSLLLGWELGSLKSYLTVLFSALVASILFTLIASYKKRIYQEAFIGIVYAFFSVLVILLFDRASRGAEHIKQTLTGYLIWAGWGETLKIFLIYTVVSIIYFVFHKKLWESSLGKSREWRWNFLFYVLFSVVIASSVSVAGVLLVFSFLIVPAFLSGFFFNSFSSRLLFGWSLGLLLSFVGLTGSYVFNLPTSPSLVFLFTSLPLVFIVGSFLKQVSSGPKNRKIQTG